MPARIVVEIIDVSDWERYRAYQQQAAPTLQPYGGTVSLIGTDGEALEGEWAPTTLGVIEFPDAEAARRWYNSPEYVEARKLRHGAARERIALRKVP